MCVCVCVCVCASAYMHMYMYVPSSVLIGWKLCHYMEVTAVCKLNAVVQLLSLTLKLRTMQLKVRLIYIIC